MERSQGVDIARVMLGCPDVRLLMVWGGVGHPRLGGIYEVHGNWIIGENDLAEAP
jgi:hypothetical protein